MSVRVAALVGVLVALAPTVLALASPRVAFAYRNPALHVAVETLAGVVALVAAEIARARFGRTLQLRDLLLTAALAVLAFANLALSVVPAALDLDVSRFATWAQLGARLAGAALFAAAALAPERILPRPRRELVRSAVAVAAVLLLLAAVCVVAADGLPAPLPPDAGGRSLSDVHIGGTLELTVSIMTLLAYAAAAWGFGRRAVRLEDPLLGWLAAAAVLAAVARLDYVLFSSLYARWFYLGDAVRLASFLVLLVGCAAELRRTQQALMDAAVLDERRRLARDLHDGVVQDLAYIVQFGRRLLQRGEPLPALERLVTTAQSALDESRHAIYALRRPSVQPLRDVLTTAAREVAGREGGVVRADISERVAVPAAAQEALARIVREAAINAFRSGGATELRIRLEEEPALRLVIEDDGCGFDPVAARATPGRLGLHTMAERARAIGAELSVSSDEGEGTRVEVVMR